MAELGVHMKGQNLEGKKSQMMHQMPHFTVICIEPKGQIWVDKANWWPPSSHIIFDRGIRFTNQLIQRMSGYIEFD